MQFARESKSLLHPRPRAESAGSPVQIPERTRFFLALLVLALIARLTLLVRRRSVEDYATIDTFAMVEIALVGLTIGALFFVPSAMQLWRRMANTSSRIWMLYYLLGAASVTWSITPSFSGYRAAVVLIESYAIILIIGSVQGFRQAERFTLILIWLSIAFRVFGNIKIGMVMAVGLRDNSLGAMAVMVACYSYGEMARTTAKRKKALRYSFLAGSFFVVTSLSLASWWSLLLGCGTVSIISRKHIILLLGACALATLICVAKPDWRHQLIYRDKPVEEVESLHGRKVLWEHYMDAFRERPIAGYGFAVGARMMVELYATNTHNLFFGVALNCGAIGLAVFGCFILRFTKEALSSLRQRREGSLGLACFLPAALLNSMTVGFLGEAWKTPTFVFVCILALACFHIARDSNPQPEPNQRRSRIILRKATAAQTLARTR